MQIMSPSPIPKLGILQLNTTLPRPPGDVGNTASWGDVPVVIRVVKEAESDLVVGGGWGEDLVDAFVREGKRMMEEEGCVAFVTSCGFVRGRKVAEFKLNGAWWCSWRQCILCWSLGCRLWVHQVYSKSDGFNRVSSLPPTVCTLLV